MEGSDFFGDDQDVLRGWNTDEHCPYPDCGKSIDDLYEQFRHCEEDTEFECPHCARPVLARVWVQYVVQRPKAQPTVPEGGK